MQTYQFGDYQWHLDSASATRPAAAMGTSVTPGNNTLGSYASVLSAVAREVMFISININSNDVSTAARDSLVTIAIDPSGGASFNRVVIPTLAAPSACALGPGLSSSTGCGVWYHFPLRIPVGASIGAAASVNNATVGTLRCRLIVHGSPRDKDSCRAGSYVVAYGANTGSSSGTAVTSGEASEGSWTSLGAITREAWYWQVGMGINNSAMTAKTYHLDLGIGDGSNKQIVIENEQALTSTVESFSKGGAYPGFSVFPAPGSGCTAYGRMQCSGTADTGTSMIAYGLGG